MKVADVPFSSIPNPLMMYDVGIFGYQLETRKVLDEQQDRHSLAIRYSASKWRNMLYHDQGPNSRF